MPRIRVESTFGGHGDRAHGFRLTMPDGSREQLIGFTWTRKLASLALDIAEHLYGYKRASVRFDVR